MYNLQYIRDLYDKMFPYAKDYIKFLKEKINILDYEGHNQNSYKKFKETKNALEFADWVNENITPEYLDTPSYKKVNDEK